VSTLVYAPSVEAHIATASGRIVDVSADIVSGRVQRRIGVSAAQLTLANAGRKYDGLFHSMDRVVVYMRRVRRLLVFTGYLDSTPAFSAYPGSISLTASCSLKRLQNWSWDPSTSAAYQLLYLGDVANRADLTDGGLAKRLIRVLSEVGGWPKAQIHIGAIPADWFTTVSGVARDIIGEATKLQLVSHVGSAGYVYGESVGEKGTQTVQGIGAGTGALPEVLGKLDSGTVYRLDPAAAAPAGSWWLTMRWPYLAQVSRSSYTLKPIPGVSTAAARRWWMGRRVLVVNPRNNKGVCLQAAGWGPADLDRGPLPGDEAEAAERVGSTTAAALKALGARTGQDLHFSFAPAGMELGPVDTSTGSLVTAGGASSGTSLSGQLSQAVGGKPLATAMADIAAAWCRKRRPYRWGAENDPSDPDPDSSDCCLTGDMIIHTGRGPVPIAEVEPGDLVQSWRDGRLVERPVVAFKAQGVQEVFELRTRNRSVRATANHPFLRLARYPRERDELGRWRPVEWRTEWARLDQIQRGDVLVTLDHLDEQSAPDRTLADGTPLDEDLAWLLGVFVGDGHVSDSYFSICVYGELRDRADAIVKRLWGLQGRHGEKAGTSYHSARVARLLAGHGLRVKSPQRRVPDVLMGAGRSVVEAFLRGYTDADGSYAKRTDCRVVEYKASSRLLVSQVHALHIELGHAVSPLSTIERTRPIVIKGKTVKSALPLHCFEWYPEQDRRRGVDLGTYGVYRVLDDDRLRLERVLKVRPAGSEETFDIEVEGEHNFVAEGLVAHNSELVEWSTRRAGGSIVDGSRNQYAAGKAITVAEARRTKGALVFIGPSPGGIHHVGVSLGDGTTAEAQSTATGCGIFPFDGQTWNYACLVPSLDYTGSGGSGTGGSPATGGATASAGGGSEPSFGEALFNVFQWIGQSDFGGDLLGGVRALMNDKPLMATVETLVTAGLRQHMSAPNGDYVAWFPDYFGWYGTAAKLVVAPVEILQEFAVAESDASLRTHWFVTSSSTGIEGLGDSTSIYHQLTTAGVVSVEMYPVMKALLREDAEAFRDKGAAFLRRYGARPEWESMDNITGPRQEFFYAMQRFQLSWASRFTGRLPLTFMPEAYPGMLVCAPHYGVQCYAQEVTHSFDLRDDQGFTTDVDGIAWSSIGPSTGIKGLVRGAPL
jgi:hypothetical protein